MLADALCCPRCAGKLSAAEGGLGCERCRTEYPMVAGMACLAVDPALWRTLWLRRLDFYLSGVEMRVGALRADACSPALLPRTRNRLERLADGLAVHRERLGALCQPLALGADPFGSEAIPPRPEPGQQAAILECYEHLFRDWVWGTAERETSLGLIAPLIPEGLSRIAVYGAGTGRLAVDLHQERSPERTFALDVNPFPFLVTTRLLAGETVDLPELPTDPESEAVVVVDRSLSCPFRVREGLSLLFADALAAPFPPGSLDAVITSWFIDVVQADVWKTAAVINRALRPGGVWINLGPLRFHTDQSRAYTIEEVLDVVSANAFEILLHDAQHLPYFHSPVSGNWRSHLVFRFAARKTAEAPALEVPDLVPPWVANPFLPIPVTPAMVALGRTSVFTAGVLTLIDGERSIVDLARQMGAAWNVDPASVQDQLHAFFAQLPSS
jgi:N2227-like protein